MTSLRRSRRDADPRRGGGGKTIPEHVPTFEAPQHGIDVNIAEAALGEIRKWMVRKALQKKEACEARGISPARPPRPPKGYRIPEASRDMYYMAKDIARGLHLDPYRTMSPRQREVLLRFVPEALREKLSKPGAPSLPPSLQNLPKRPPQRKKEEDDDE